MDAPGNIAFILPISSPYKAAAEAILDGFKAMNSDQSMGNRYALRIYDYGREPTNAPLYYRQAIIEGADLVIGPLGRQSVESLMTQPELTTPTVILSPPGDEMTTTNNLYQFSLSQELEAEHVAQRAWLDGHRRAAILYPATAIGQRMAIAFANRFVGLGGEVISDERYQPGNTDFSASVRKLLDIESSEQRIAAMKSLLGEKIVSETRRRQDIDLIFLPATNKNARLIKPVLDFFYAFDLPVYSTSRIFPGHLDTVGDIDLEGIRFPDMPWMIATNVEIESLRTFLQGAWPNRETSYNRLYALGMDLHSIIPLIDGFSRNPLLHYRGLSGILNMDENGIIDRQLLWAKFRRGTPGLMDRVSNYQGRYNEKKFRQGSATPPGNRN
jgi:outer membrane PBP1 activator LpoA protein